MTPSNPLAALAALASGQGGPSPAGGPPDPAQNPLGQMVSQQLGQLRGANPQMVLDMLKQMKQLTAALIPHTAESIPGVARYLASNLRGLDSAIEAANKAQMTAQLVGGPIQMSAAPSSGQGMF